MEKKLFGTDGIRGLVGGEIVNTDMAQKIGQAMALYCEKNNLSKKIILGRDTRESGPELEQAAIYGINSGKGEASSAGIVSTPGLVYLTRVNDFSLGLMITASHNPTEYNGFKIFNSRGEKLGDSEIFELEEYILRVQPRKKAENNFKEFKIDSYLGMLSEIISNNSLADKKIVIDCANGATSEVAQSVFNKISKFCEFLNVKPDGKNINKDCGSQYTQNLQVRVKEVKADIGVAFDGDGDRVIVTDEAGGRLTGDHIIYICAQAMLKKSKLKNNLVVSTTMSNLGFVKALENLGIKHVWTDVGDRQVYEAMILKGASLGGEEAGHIIFRDHLPSGDGILTVLRLLMFLEELKKPLSELASEINLFPKKLVNLTVKSKPPLEELDELNKIIKEVKKKLGNNGRVVARYSGTESLFRVMVEAETYIQVDEYNKLITDKAIELMG